MNLDLSGKRALVCGSTQGIGHAAAVELANLGCTVTLAARNWNKLTNVLEHLPRPHGQVHDGVIADFEHPQEAADAVSAKLREMEAAKEGGKEVAACYHILLNNTGGPPGGPLAEATLAQLAFAEQTQLHSAHLLMQQVVPGMKAAGYGRIINVISTSVKQPIAGLGVSNTVRGAVANWAKTLAAELGAFGITVNNVLPGATLTQRHHNLVAAKAKQSGAAEHEIEKQLLAHIPAGRFGTAQELAAAIAFLASPAAAYINGVNLPVDGGRTLCL